MVFALFWEEFLPAGNWDDKLRVKAFEVFKRYVINKIKLCLALFCFFFFPCVFFYSTLFTYPIIYFSRIALGFKNKIPLEMKITDSHMVDDFEIDFERCVIENVRNHVLEYSQLFFDYREDEKGKVPLCKINFKPSAVRVRTLVQYRNTYPNFFTFLEKKFEEHSKPKVQLVLNSEEKDTPIENNNNQNTANNENIKDDLNLQQPQPDKSNKTKRDDKIETQKPIDIKKRKKNGKK